jgi:hypothetical protein
VAAGAVTWLCCHQAAFITGRSLAGTAPFQVRRTPRCQRPKQREQQMALRNHRRPTLMITLIAVLGIVAVLLRSRRRRSASGEERADVGFMLAMHHALRRDMADVEARMEIQDDGTGRAEMIERWGELRQRLGRHHTAEDDDLWPVLRRNLTDPLDQREVDDMVDEHHRLADLIAAADRAFASPDVAPQPMFADLGSALRAHLDHEERTVLPLLERHLSRAEWRRFLVTERSRTPLRERPTFLAWVLDGAEEADREAVLGQLPPPGRVVYRRVIGPRYRARHPRPRTSDRPRSVAVSDPDPGTGDLESASRGMTPGGAG